MLLILLVPVVAYASGGSATFEQNTLFLVVTLTLAKWIGFMCKKVGIPELVGELGAGLVLGNLGLFGWHVEFTHNFLSSEFIKYAADLGVVLLLFLVGLESNLTQLLKVGKNAFVVAAVGVILPVIGGYFYSSAVGLGVGVAAWFVGATLAATSVGITAKVLGDRKLLMAPSSQVILGAAVIDDIMGILLLTVLAGVAMGGEVSFIDLGVILLKAGGFFVGSYFAGRLLFPRMIRLTGKNDSKSFWVAFSLILALVFAQVAAMAGMAPIIGAFFAGLLLEDVHFEVGHKLQKDTIEHLLSPIAEILLPIFFVAIGAQVDLSVLGDMHVLMVVLGLLVIAVISKTATGALVKGPQFDRWGIGLGMVPRGEVGLIFASYALQHKVFTASAYSVLVLVVLFSTILGPMLLKYRLDYFEKSLA